MEGIKMFFVVVILIWFKRDLKVLNYKIFLDIENWYFLKRKVLFDFYFVLNKDFGNKDF